MGPQWDQGETLTCATNNTTSLNPLNVHLYLALPRSAQTAVTMVKIWTNQSQGWWLSEVRLTSRPLDVGDAIAGPLNRGLMLARLCSSRNSVRMRHSPELALAYIVSGLKTLCRLPGGLECHDGLRASSHNGREAGNMFDGI